MPCRGLARSPWSESESVVHWHSWGSDYESEVAAARAAQAVFRSESLQGPSVHRDRRQSRAGPGIFFHSMPFLKNLNFAQSL